MLLLVLVLLVDSSVALRRSAAGVLREEAALVDAYADDDIGVRENKLCKILAIKSRNAK